MLPGKGGWTRRRRAFAATAAALACVSLLAPAARAELFEVDHVGDQVDASPGNGLCATAGEGCTLRAAIEEADALAGGDRIAFKAEVFDGQPAATIVLGTGLPAISERLTIEGKECPAKSGHPCAGTEGPSGGTALTVHSEGVEIFGLAITGAKTGIEAESSPGFKAQANWLGVGLGGSADGDETGIFVGPGSSNSRIGGEGPEARNVIAASGGDGLAIHGTSGAKVLGNYFGVAPDGTTPLANQKDIEVTSVSGGAQASGTAIGTKLKAAPAATPQCDGGCNLISGASSSGIDLQGDGGAEAPATQTTILGNYVGLDAGGSTAIANAGTGVRVGEAAQTVLGGPKTGEANRIDGGAVAVQAGPAASDLLVRGNLIGLDASGAVALAPPGAGIAVESATLPSAAVEATIAGNAIAVGGGAGIAQGGFGATISANRIAGGEPGIWVHGSNAKHGNLIVANSIAETQGSGILIESDLNEVVGNEIGGAVGAGILIKGLPPFGVKENLLGGDSPAAENTIDGTAGAAIEIFDAEPSVNEVARNRGAANSGPFIDLVASGSETKWPNKGIAPPAIDSATETGASGSGALPGAHLRLFGKQTAATGELHAFLGEAKADAEGEWEVSYAESVPAGTIVAATQTSELGGTSELATATTAGEAAGAGTGGTGGGGAGSGGSEAGASAAAAPLLPAMPQTKIVTAPRKRSRGATVRFGFESEPAGAIFECKLDRRPFAPCKSPKRYANLKPGRHLFEVRAIDADGHVDPSPARERFSVPGPSGGRSR